MHVTRFDDVAWLSCLFFGWAQLLIEFTRISSVSPQPTLFPNCSICPRKTDRYLGNLSLTRPVKRKRKNARVLNHPPVIAATFLSAEFIDVSRQITTLSIFC